MWPKKEEKDEIIEDLKIKSEPKEKKPSPKKEKKSASNDEAYLNHPKFAKFKTQGDKKNDK